MKHYVGRLACIAAISAISVGAVWQFGIPHVKLHDISGGATVLNINGTAISEQEYAQYFNYYKNYMDQQYTSYGVDVETQIYQNEEERDSYVEMLFEMTDQQITYSEVILRLFDENGYVLDRLEQKTLENSILESAAYYNSMYDGGLQKVLDGYNISNEMYENILIIAHQKDILEGGYLSEYTVSEQIDALGETYVNAKHVLISNTDESGNALTEAQNEERAALAQQVLEKALAGENFDALIAEYGEDYGMTYYVDGYTFTEGEMVDEFYNGVISTEIGKVHPEVVESRFGWHIIQRGALSEADLVTYSDEVQQTLKGATFVNMMVEQVQSSVIERTDAYGQPNYERMLQLTA